MIKVQIFSVETFLVEKLPGRIYKGNPFIKKNGVFGNPFIKGIPFRKICNRVRQLENPTHVLEPGGEPLLPSRPAEGATFGWIRSQR